GYSGTVHFTSTSANAVLPPNVTLTNGVGSFLVTFKTAQGGPWTVTAQDTSHPTIDGTSGNILVSPGMASYFAVAVPSASVSTGTPIGVTVTAFDPYGNIVTGYSGHVHFTSSDAHANLPAPSTLT